MSPVATWALAEEVVDVLRRPRIAKYGVDEADIGAVLAVLAPFLPAVDVEVALRDPRDVPVVAAALAGRAEAIVTGDQDLLADRGLLDWLRARGVEVLAPATLLERLGR